MYIYIYIILYYIILYYIILYYIILYYIESGCGRRLRANNNDASHDEHNNDNSNNTNNHNNINNDYNDNNNIDISINDIDAYEYYYHDTILYDNIM